MSRPAIQPARLQLSLAKVIAQRRAIDAEVHDAAALQDHHPAPPSICVPTGSRLVSFFFTPRSDLMACLVSVVRC